MWEVVGSKLALRQTVLIVICGLFSLGKSHLEDLGVDGRIILKMI
jgi:hypothetical protein